MASQPPPLRIYAHRGASATHPENSLEAFAEALRLGVDGIELDLRATRDGVLVVAHDASLGRTQGRDVKVNDLSLVELREAAPLVPTFAELLAEVGGRCHLDIEIKEAGVEAAALDLLSGLARDRWAISSFDWDVLREVRGLDQAAELWVLCLAVSAGAIDAADGLDATTLAVEQSAITPEVIERADTAGRRVMAWTVNDPARAALLGRWGVAAICTDDPASMLPRAV